MASSDDVKDAVLMAFLAGVAVPVTAAPLLVDCLTRGYFDGLGNGLFLAAILITGASIVLDALDDLDDIDDQGDEKDRPPQQVDEL